jgi:hypothetical protein
MWGKGRMVNAGEKVEGLEVGKWRFMAAKGERLRGERKG